MAEKHNPDDRLFEDSLRSLLRRKLANKVEQNTVEQNNTANKTAIQKSRDVAYHMRLLLNQEMTTIQSQGLELVAGLCDSAAEKEIARTVFSQISGELLEELVADWTWVWKSDYLQLSASASTTLSVSVIPRKLETIRPETTSLPSPRPRLGLLENSNPHAARLLEQWGSESIRSRVIGRQVLRLDGTANSAKQGYIFKWPPNNDGVDCVAHCLRCNFTSKTDPLARNHTQALWSHWKSKSHPDWKEIHDAFFLFSLIMLNFTYRVEGKTVDEIQKNNIDIIKGNEYNQRKSKAYKQQKRAASSTPSTPSASSTSSGATNTAKRLNGSSSSTQDLMRVALGLGAANTTATQRSSNSNEPAISPPTGDLHHLYSPESFFPRPSLNTSNTNTQPGIINHGAGLEYAQHMFPQEQLSSGFGSHGLPAAQDMSNGINSTASREHGDWEGSTNRDVAVKREMESVGDGDGDGDGDDTSGDEPMLGKRSNRPILLD